MSWLYFLLAAGSFVIALTTRSQFLFFIALLLSLAFTVLFFMGMLAKRMGNDSNKKAMIIDPRELERMREQAAAKRQQEAANTAGHTTAPTTSNEPSQH